MSDNAPCPAELVRLERSSYGLPHPLSLRTGLVMVRAGFFVPLPEPADGWQPLFSHPFPMQWPFHGMRATSRAQFGCVKALYQGYGILPDRPLASPHPPLPTWVSPLRYKPDSDATVRRRLAQCDGDAPQRLWAVPLYEPATAAFLLFRRGAHRDHGEMFLRVPACTAPQVLVVYRIPREAPSTPTCFVFPIARQHDPDHPVGLAPECPAAFLVAILLRETGQGEAHRLPPVRFCPPPAQTDTARVDCYSQAGDAAFGGRQEYPQLYVEADQASRPETPEAGYRLLCQRFEAAAIPDPGPTLCQWIRELEAAVVRAERAAVFSQGDLDALWRQLEEAETRLLPLYVGGLGLAREKVVANASDEPPVARGLLAALTNETQIVWKNLHDIRFRRLPSLARRLRTRVVLGPRQGPGPGPFRGPGDVVSFPERDVLFVSVPQANNTLLRFEDAAARPRRITGPWRGLGRLRPDGDGVRLLDPVSGTLVRLSARGEPEGVLDLGLHAIDGGSLRAVDFLLTGGHAFLACVSADGDRMRCLDVPGDGGPATVAFSLDQDVFPFEVWDVWRDALVLVVNKTASLYVWSRTDAAWDRHELPLRHSFCKGLVIRGDIALLHYPPALVVYDLRRRHLLEVCHAPHVVGQWPGQRTFAAERDGRGQWRLFVSDEAGRLGRYALELPEPAAFTCGSPSCCPRETR